MRKIIWKSQVSLFKSSLLYHIAFQVSHFKSPFQISFQASLSKSSLIFFFNRLLHLRETGLNVAFILIVMYFIAKETGGCYQYYLVFTIFVAIFKSRFTRTNNVSILYLILAQMSNHHSVANQIKFLCNYFFVQIFSYLQKPCSYLVSVD